MLFLHSSPFERRRVLARGWQFVGNSHCELLALQLRGSRECVLFTFVQFVEFYGSEAVAPGKAGLPNPNMDIKFLATALIVQVEGAPAKLPSTAFLASRVGGGALAR